jgi:hypothetical protein
MNLQCIRENEDLKSKLLEEYQNSQNKWSKLISRNAIMKRMILRTKKIPNVIKGPQISINS